MREIIHWYYKNKKIIFGIIGIFAITIIIIQLLTRLSAQNQKNEIERIISSGADEDLSLKSITLEYDKSIISGNNISTTQTNALKVLDEFANYCNNKKINEAYALLSVDCKKEMFPTTKEFKEIYYNPIFNDEQKNISVENWVGNIYKISFIEDPLSTGTFNTENSIQDYITIVKDEDNQIKLNINNYIGRYEINKQDENDNIKIEVLEKQTYMDFETYIFEITNNSYNTILLSELNNPETMYLEDKNHIKYFAYMHELSESEMKVIPGETKKITIKYYNKYSSRKDIKKVEFSNIILNYNVYKQYENVAYYNNYGTIQIKL